MARHTHAYILTWLIVAWSLLTAAAWLAVHRQKVRMLRTALPEGMACSIVRQPRTVWILLDAARPQAARVELSYLLSSWPTEQTGESLPRLALLAPRPVNVTAVR